MSLHHVILNVVKNLSERIDVGAIVDSCAIPEILRSAQDDNTECKHTICIILNVSPPQFILNASHYNVILNVVKNLSERIDVGAIVEGCAILEILRYAQDDNVECKQTLCIILNVSSLLYVILNVSPPRHSERSEESLGM